MKKIYFVLFSRFESAMFRDHCCVVKCELRMSIHEANIEYIWCVMQMYHVIRRDEDGRSCQNVNSPQRCCSRSVIRLAGNYISTSFWTIFKFDFSLKEIKSFVHQSFSPKSRNDSKMKWSHETLVNSRSSCTIWQLSIDIFWRLSQNIKKPKVRFVFTKYSSDVCQAVRFVCKTFAIFTWHGTCYWIKTICVPQKIAFGLFLAKWKPCEAAIFAELLTTTFTGKTSRTFVRSRWQWCRANRQCD